MMVAKVSAACIVKLKKVCTVAALFVSKQRKVNAIEAKIRKWLLSSFFTPAPDPSEFEHNCVSN